MSFNKVALKKPWTIWEQTHPARHALSKPRRYLLKYQKLFTDPARLSFVIFKMASLKVILLIYDSLLAPKTKPLLFPQIHLPPFSNKKLQKIESFYLGNTLGNYKSNLNKINEVTIISILRFTWNSSLLSFFNSTRIILRHVAKSHFFTFFKGL